MIDREEFAGVIERIFPSATEEEVDAMFDYIDVDGAKEISIPELLKSTVLQVRECFAKFDSSGDGSLSCDEFRRLCICVFGTEFGLAIADQIFKKVDEDRSGAIEFVEFLEASVLEVVEAFRKVDTSRRGFLRLNQFKPFLGTIL